MSKSSVRVYVRLRPVIHEENQEPEETCLRTTSHNKVELLNWRDTRETLEYTFKQVFAEDSTQEEVYCTCVQPVLSRFIEQRQNVTIFTYGPTGAGKTFTILGTNEHPGIIPRTIRSLFSKVRQMTTQDDNFLLSMSYLEIYQEKVYDLLKKENKDLNIRQDQEGNIFVPGITQQNITNFETFERLFIPASENRRVAATKLNTRSSRSHSILQIQMKSWNTSKPNHHQIAKLYLIDLAGSEDNRRTGNTGVRLKESGSINSSLHVLGKVVDALNAGTSARIPYRDSKLTRLLQDSLGGSAHTCMIVNVSPEMSSLLDTHSTMNFATKSKNIINRPFTRETKSEVEDKPVIKQETQQKETCDSPAEQNPLPFLSPLIKKHVSKIESKLYSRLEDLEKLVMKAQSTRDIESHPKPFLQLSDQEEKFRKHDDHLDEIRKSSKQFKSLHYQHKLLKEEKENERKRQSEVVLHDDFSPLLIKRKKISTASKLNLPAKTTTLSLHRRTLLTIEKQQLSKTSQEIITIKVPADTRNIHASKILEILNNGSEKDLKKLHGIGGVRASQIFSYRNENGSFENVEDLEKVLPKQFVHKFLESTLLHNCHVQLQ
ncbi:kinesin-like protein KIF22 [Styela clava]